MVKVESRDSMEVSILDKETGDVVGLGRRQSEARPASAVLGLKGTSFRTGEVFSGRPKKVEPVKVRAQTKAVLSRMFLKAVGLAPSSFCPRESSDEVRIITAIFASSEGWNCKPMKDIHREAPFTRSPEMSPMPKTNIRSSTEAG